MRSVHDKRWQGRSILWVATAAYTVFVVYGSLVPLHFEPRPLAEAWTRFRTIPYLQLSIDSRSDWVANILLFIPLSFFWMELTSFRNGRLARMFFSASVFAGCFALSVAIEFTQIFFPPRTVSINDVVAETIGAAAGIACAWLFGQRVRSWLVKLSKAQGSAILAERAFWGYLLFLVLYNVMPLDLTISPTEIYHKWEQGRVVLNPFHVLQDDMARGSYEAITDGLIWAPVALLFVVAGRGGRFSALLTTTGIATAIEIAQLFVYSRVTDLGDIVTAAIGAALGAAIGSRLRRRAGGRLSISAKQMTLAGVVAAVVWFCILCILFWYPFDFRGEPAYGIQRLGMLWNVPFLSYYWNSEYQALSGLLRKTLLFLPLGTALAVAFHPLRGIRARRLAAAVATLIVFFAAAAIELGKAFIPQRYPDSTDLFLQLVGGIVGYILYSATRSRIEEHPTLRYSSPSLQRSEFRPVKRRVPASERSLVAAKTGCAVFFLGSVLWFLSKVPEVPYNFRNLFHPSYPFVSALLVAAALIWSAGFPAWISRRLATYASAIRTFPAWILLYGLIAWLLIFFAVEPLRAYKLVGSPILNWPWHFEWLLRFLALMAGIGAFAVLGCIIGGDGRYLRRRLRIWVCHAMWLLPLVYWAVISQAATDNIVELLAWNANPGAASLIGLVIVTLFAAGTRLHVVFSATPPRQRALGMAFVSLSFPIGYLLLQLGTEPVIEKYGKVFSGMQFMLSADRQHYAESTDLLVRYLVFHLSFLLAAAIGRWLFVGMPGRAEWQPTTSTNSGRLWPGVPSSIASGARRLGR